MIGREAAPLSVGSENSRSGIAPPIVDPCKHSSSFRCEWAALHHPNGWCARIRSEIVRKHRRTVSWAWRRAHGIRPISPGPGCRPQSHRGRPDSGPQTVGRAHRIGEM